MVPTFFTPLRIKKANYKTKTKSKTPHVLLKNVLKNFFSFLSSIFVYGMTVKTCMVNAHKLLTHRQLHTVCSEIHQV